MSGGLLRRLKRIVSPGEGRSAEPGEREAAPRQVRLIVGLGNPGKEYAGNRHNVGFWTVNRLARRHGIEVSSAGQAALGQGRVGERAVALAKPRTFVNKSGVAVWNLIKRLELDDGQELLVVCDDIDLPVGKARLRPSGGSGGYKGLQSIIDATGSDQFPRLRIGIGRPVIGGKPSYDPDVVAALTHGLGLRRPTARVLSNRGI
ncbi:MAG: aminoacyl-tRNA hydrolase, partial [Dehalococcoidia bacterium]|nr:aminoacyl-tRNA hydrolase [Dehalococcoidia bacterium]